MDNAKIMTTIEVLEEFELGEEIIPKLKQFSEEFIRREESEYIENLKHKNNAIVSFIAYASVIVPIEDNWRDIKDDEDLQSVLECIYENAWEQLSRDHFSTTEAEIIDELEFD